MCVLWGLLLSFRRNNKKIVIIATNRRKVSRVWIRITEAIVNNRREFRVYYDGQLLETFSEFKEAQEFYDWLEHCPDQFDSLDFDEWEGDND